MKRQLWHRLSVVFSILILILSYTLPAAVAAETISAKNTDKLTLLSAQTNLDDSGNSYLELKAMVSNQSQETAVQDIIVSGNQLADISEPLEMDGVSSVVDKGTISLTVAPMTHKEVELHFAIDDAKSVEGQGMKLISGNQELVVEKKQTTASTDPMPESETGTTETEGTAESEIQDEMTDEEVEGDEEGAGYSPFIGPRLFSSRAATQMHNPIVPQYTTDETGMYPTASWQPANQKNVINHQGNKNGSSQWDGVTSWDGNPENKANSYIEYGGTGDQADYAIRKYARETTTPGLFDVYLNVKGNYKKNIKPMDIVLVVDWSGSMKDYSRIDFARMGIRSFLNIINESGNAGNINLGYVTYSDEIIREVPIGPFNNAKTQIENVLNDRPGGGTFTEKALVKADEMFNYGNDHDKVIVLLTDGAPTYSYQASEVAYDAANNYYYGTKFRGQGQGATFGNGQGISYNSTYNAKYGNKNVPINDTFTSTVGRAKDIQSRAEIHGLGIQLTNFGGWTAQRIRTMMEQMVSRGPDGALYYESIDEASKIVDYLTNKAIGFSGTVANGVINDPIAEPFSFVPGSLTHKTFGGAVKPNYSESSGTITANNINLVKGQEIQLHYQVRLKTEGNDFKPDYWYQMNGKTTFQPLGNAGETVEFGVPSGKAPGAVINLEKHWEEFDGDRSGRPDQVTFEVEREQTTDGNSWKTGYADINKPANDTTDTWKQEAVTQLSSVAGETLYLPKYNNNGVDFTYKVVNEAEVDGYTHEINGTTVTNTKKFKPYNLLIKKKSSAGDELLTGAVFTLTGGRLNVTLNDNGDGTYTLPADATLDKNQTYTLTETIAPDGHELSGKTTWEIKVAANGKVTIDGKTATIANQQIELTITNMFKKVPIAVWKYRLDTDGTQNSLADATFKLEKKNVQGTYEKVSEGTSKDDGMVSLQSVEPGEYRVVETKGPKGYDTRPGNYEFTVDIYGNINYSGENVKAGEKIWTFTHENKLKPFDLTVNKLDDDKKALKGARFKLTGPELGEGIELPADGAELDTFHFKDLKPGVYELTETFTPEGYRGLEKPVSITIHENGKVTIDGEVFDDLLVEGEGHNQVELDVMNYAKIKLPDTGGNGRLLIYLTGAAALIVAVGYLFFRFSHQKEVG